MIGRVARPAKQLLRDFPFPPPSILSRSSSFSTGQIQSFDEQYLDFTFFIAILKISNNSFLVSLPIR